MASDISFAHLWQDDMSDLDLILAADAQHSDADHTGTTADHPGKIARWKRKRPHAGDDGSGTSSSGGDAAGKQQLVLTLQDEEQLPAALAVLSALYLVKPTQELLSDLPQEQQLHAALLADMWQIQHVSTRAVQLLTEAALQGAAVKLYLGLEAHPDCLLPLLPAVAAAVLKPAEHPDQQVMEQLKRALLCTFGDLEEVWANVALRDVLMKLPLPGMELLLGYDELKVASEDTILYTAQTYVRAIKGSQQQAAAKERLAPVIRCPHLSGWWRAALAVSAEARKLLLSGQQKELKQLLMLQQVSDISKLTASELQSLLPGAPVSWAGPQRVSREVSSVQVTWRLDMDQLIALARKSAAERKSMNMHCPCVTPPLGGVAFGIWLQAVWKPQEEGVELGMYVLAKDLPSDVFYRFNYDLHMHDGPEHEGTVRLSRACRRAWGARNFFWVSTMAGGWDEAVWVDYGLPTSGELVFTAKVTAVDHAINS